MTKNQSTALFRLAFLKGSAVLLVGSIIGNFASYLYHLLMGRMLGPADYGALEAVISLIYLLNVPVITLFQLTTRTVSKLRGRKKENLTFSFRRYLISQALIFGLVVSLLLFLTAPIIKNFLHLDSYLTIISLLGFFLTSLFWGINTGFLNGFLKFFYVSLLWLILPVGKLVSGLFLVNLKQRVFGATSAFTVGTVIGLGLSFLLFKKVEFENDQVDKNWSLASLAKDFVPFFVLSFAFNSIFTTDIFLARHFLPAKEAGFYASLAVLGKIIYFASYPVSQAMFPIVSERHAAGDKYRRIFLLSLGLVFLVSFGIGSIYLLFPDLMIGILFGREYLFASGSLGIFALFLGFYSLSFLAAQFFLAIGKNAVVYGVALVSFLQVVLILLFHRTLAQIAWVSTISCGLLFFGLMLYFLIGRQPDPPKCEAEFDSAKLLAGEESRWAKSEF